MNGARHRLLAGVALALTLGSCGPFIEYTDGLRKSPDNSPVVRYTAQAGGVVGAIASIPVGVVALPVTGGFYLYQSSVDPENASLTDTVLFPSFVLIGVGSLLAVPVDLLELVVYRSWADPTTPTAEEQEEIEQELDNATLPRYPVEAIYPPQSADPGDPDGEPRAPVAPKKSGSP